MAPSPPPSLAQRLTGQLTGDPRWVVLAMLLALHAALFSQPAENFQRIWLLVHFGLFLVWQPFVAAERELEPLAVVLLVAITVAVLYFLAGWMIMMWLLLLLGILGGRVFTVQATRRNRLYLVAFAYVLIVLLLWAVPVLLLGRSRARAPRRFRARCADLLLSLALVPLGPCGDGDAGQVFDFFYAVLVFQLGVVLVLGSIAVMRYTDDNYFASVALTVLGFGAALFVLAVLWNPTARLRGPTHVLLALPAVGGHALRALDAAHRRSSPRSSPISRRFLEQALARDLVAAVDARRRVALARRARAASASPTARLRDALRALLTLAEGDLPLRASSLLAGAELPACAPSSAQVVVEVYEGKRQRDARCATTRTSRQCTRPARA